MEITWMGHSCFIIKGKGATLVTDPYDESIGFTLGKLKANVVTSSHPHPGHGFTTGVEDGAKIVKGPGEYEVAGVFITGTPTFHDDEKGASRGKNTVYLIEMEDITLCHLGDLGHALSTGQVEEISSADILMVPVGGVSTIDASAAAEIVRQLEPRLVIPMHFHSEGLKFQLDPVDKFLKEMGIKADVAAELKLTVTKASLPEETRVVLLERKSGS